MQALGNSVRGLREASFVFSAHGGKITMPWRECNNIFRKPRFVVLCLDGEKVVFDQLEGLIWRRLIFCSRTVFLIFE